MSKSPSGAWAMATCGAPRRRMARVSRRVSMPPMPIRPRRASQVERSPAARQLDGSVGSHFTTMPAAKGSAVSSSSGVTPTLPMWGKVKVTICPA